MPRLEYDGVACDRAESESVLDALLRAGLVIPHACKAGVCGSCLMRAADPAAVPAAAQRGLKATWVASGYFLACVCRPAGDLVVTPVGHDARVPAEIASVERLSDTVLRVRLAVHHTFDYRAGQYVTLVRRDGLARSYSLASLPDDTTLELHVRVFPDGRMSQWLASQGVPGTPIQVQGPSGHCFYIEGRPDQPMLLAGTGTGLAPLVGIVRDAMSRGHRGPIHLIHGAVSAAGLYLEDELTALAERHPNLRMWRTTLEADGPIDRTIASQVPSVAGFRVFLRGSPSIVQALRKRIYLAGASLGDIHADEFLPAASS